ncbi:hypothetical protein EJ04DRAFT_517433 [Polyplosphaeria fusca]|uniref:Uncharacterized protein n=1 Tax=Polyplosphaeria fusca TaxID=682080 RepID=A0A9P4QKI5_9PLEO|nr:hypothetical protein EJ04DRAFT_517433 [Polyplosphaeria fusca]
MADFAPYQDIPEQARALSPPPVTSPRASLDRTRNIGTGSLTSPSNQNFPGRNGYFPPQSDSARGFGGRVMEDTSEMFQTSLGLDLKYEACLAYLLLPPAGGVLLLILEHKSDYVRFHAWQSSLLFAFIFVVHIIFSWTSILSWLIFVVDLGIIGFLTYHAYTDADNLDRYEVPFFGPLASSIVDDE